jgi:bifunctional non-homologous end joining protein LigD
MPMSVTPMLATKVGAPFSRAGWLFEPKWDGYRAVCFLRDGEVHLLQGTSEISPNGSLSYSR